MPRPSRAGSRLGAALLLLLVPLSARADLIFLKDGTVLQGKLIQETKIDFDQATKEPFYVASGLFHIDEGPYRKYFCQTQVEKVVARQESTSEVRIGYRTTFSSAPLAVPPIHQIETQPWDAKWNRKIRISSQGHPATVQQHLAVLTPFFAKADSRTYYWAQYYLTRELGPEVVESLIATNPDVEDDPKLKPAERVARRFKVCDFYAQAGWYELAEAELTKLADKFPDQKERVAAAREALHASRARDRFEVIKHLHLAGQYKTVKAALEAFPDAEATGVTAADVRTFRASFEEAAATYADTVRMLDDVLRGLKAAKDAPEGLAAALAAVRAEIHPDRAARLEAFLGQALQAERQRKAGRTAESSPATLAALAVTGWLLGGPSADPKPETALRLWRSRQLVLAYLRADDAGAREKLINDYDRRKVEFAGLDEICQLIPQLPPEAPEPDTKPAVMELKAGDTKRGPLYLLKLPPEYSHSRQYPVLLALPPYGEAANLTVQRHEGVCAENGYILAVPRWEEKGSGGGYTFSENEHKVVLDVLRDVRRRFQVDSDRVFLTGAGFGGGDMAFDVGLSHPDLFAGVIPIGAGPSYFSEVYWRSAQYLPFYIIAGDRSGDGNKKIRDLFNNWVPRGFNSMWVQYKGRGVEWFGGELPAAFDWMRNKRRPFPMRQLGSEGYSTLGSEFYSMRQSDNRFYWVTADEIEANCCNTFEGWSNRRNAARVSARVDPDKNEIHVSAVGMRRLTVWLGRNSKGSNLIDFDKPLTVWKGLSPQWSNRKVTPSLDVLLSDLAERGDRQQLFLAKVQLR